MPGAHHFPFRGQPARIRHSHTCYGRDLATVHDVPGGSEGPSEAAQASRLHLALRAARRGSQHAQVIGLQHPEGVLPEEGVELAAVLHYRRGADSGARAVDLAGLVDTAELVESACSDGDQIVQGAPLGEVGRLDHVAKAYAQGGAVGLVDAELVAVRDVERRPDEDLIDPVLPGVDEAGAEGLSVHDPGTAQAIVGSHKTGCLITDGNGDGAGTGRSVCVLELRLKTLPPEVARRGRHGRQDLREVQVGGGAQVPGHRQIPGEVPGRTHVRVVGARAGCEYERES